MIDDDRKTRTVRLPFEFGQRVYHQAAIEKSPGLVTGFAVCPGVTMVQVTWGDDQRATQHYFFELSTEWEPELS